MIVTWTVLRSHPAARALPWQPRGADWWQGGHTGRGRAEPPPADGVWWSVLATWEHLADAAVGPEPWDGLDAWHVALRPACYRGDAVLADGARPFDGLPERGQVHGATGVITLAELGADDAREREFTRRFLHLGRSVAQAPGVLAASVQAPESGAVLTFSAWRDVGAATDWAYARPPHAAAVARQGAHRLVLRTGFLRGAVVSSSGRLGDRPDPLAGLRGEVP